MNRRDLKKNNTINELSGLSGDAQGIECFKKKSIEYNFVLNTHFLFIDLICDSANVVVAIDSAGLIIKVSALELCISYVVRCFAGRTVY